MTADEGGPEEALGHALSRSADRPRRSDWQDVTTLVLAFVAVVALGLLSRILRGGGNAASGSSWSSGDPARWPLRDRESRDALTYDDTGRKTSETDALGRRTEWTYDKADRIVNVTLKIFDNRDAMTRDIVIASNTYDAAGNPLTEETGGGKRKLAHTYDAIGRRTSTTLNPAGAD